MHTALMARRPQPIEDRAKRLKQAREVKYRTALEAANALGVPPGTYYGHENGSRGITADEGRRYADFYGVRVEWLMYNRGQRQRPKDPLQELIESIPAARRPLAIRMLEAFRQDDGEG